MADQTLAYTENIVGSGHPTLADTVNRLTLVAHNNDGTHKAGVVLDSPVINNGYTEEVYNLTGTEISAANGSIQYKTLSGNTTFTEALSDGQSVTLMLNPATYTTTWPTCTWIGSVASTAPTLVASVYNCITFFQFGGTLYGKYEGRV